MRRVRRLLLLLPPDGTRTDVVSLLRPHFPVVVSTDPEDVSAVLRAQPGEIDLVLVDAGFGEDRLEHVTRVVRAAAPTRPVPVVVVAPHGRDVTPPVDVPLRVFTPGPDSPLEMLLYEVNAALFPAERDDRASPRVLLTAGALVETEDGGTWAGEIFNVSMGGVFVRLSDAPALGAHVSLRFPLPPDDSPVVVVGEVVRRVAPADDTDAPGGAPMQVPGIGVRFVGMDPAVRSRIARFVVSRGPSALFRVEALHVTRDARLTS